MNRADEIRDQIRQMRYLIEERKFIDDMLRKIEDQKNRLQVEELSLRKMFRVSQNDTIITNNVTDIEEEEEEDEGRGQQVLNTDNNYFSSGTPSRPIEVPIVECFQLADNIVNNKNNPKAVAETLELDVSQVLLKLASGGNEALEEEVEEESDQDY